MPAKRPAVRRFSELAALELAQIEPVSREDDPATLADPRFIGAMRRAVARLSPKQRAVLMLRYGLADGHVYTPWDTGSILRIPRAHVLNMEAGATRCMRS